MFDHSLEWSDSLAEYWKETTLGYHHLQHKKEIYCNISMHQNVEHNVLQVLELTEDKALKRDLTGDLTDK